MILSRRLFTSTLAALPILPQSQAQSLPQRPKLLLLLVAEQFRTDYFDSHPNAFSRLLNNSAYFPNCYLESVSFTASGLATLATGAYPAVHGIVAGRWFDRKITDATADLIQGSTLSSQLLAADPRNRVYGIGLDARMTRMLTGVTPYSPENVKTLNPDPSTPKTEWLATGATTSTPMRSLDPANAKDFPVLWRASPLGQAAQFAYARELITGEKLGKGEGLDMLCMLLNSSGALGLEGGANSPLVYDLVSHLDRQIDSLLKFLDDSLGENAYQVVFTAAHGAPDSPGKRIAAKDIAAAVEKVAPVEAYIYPNLYLRSGDPIAAAKASGAAAWYTASGTCSHTGTFRRRLENSYHPTRSGQALLAYPPGAAEDFPGGRGVSYGSIYNYDTRVPLVLYGPQFRPLQSELRVELADLAPTLARAFGVAPPSSSTGRVLGEAFTSFRRNR